MSLRVWLPLTKDLRNQGLSNVTPSLLGNPTYTNGKLGQALNITTDGQGINLNGYMTELKTYITYSMAAWVYLDSTATNHSSTIISSGNWNTAAGQCCFGFYSYNSGYGIILCPNTSSWSGGISLSSKIQLNNWYHITITYNGSKTIAYVNGEKVGEYNGGGICQSSETNNVYIGSATYYSGFTLKGKINDVRIYNHCLSASEVKEISKGLILHYPLNAHGLLTSRYDTTLYTEPDGTIWTRIAHHNNPSAGLFASTDTFTTGVYKDADRWYDIEEISNFVSNFDFMVKQKTTSGATEVKYRWIQTKKPAQAVWADVQPSAVTRITTSGYTDGTYGGIYKNNGNTRMVIANSNSGNWYGAFGSWTAYNSGIPGYPNTTITTGYMDLYIRVDNIGGTTEYDYSGFGNNGSKITDTITNVFDAPKYKVSTHFNGTYDGILIENLQISDIINSAVTYAFWIKPEGEAGARSVYFGSYSTGPSWSIEKTTGNIIRSYWNGSPDETCSGATITDGVWQHVCLTKNGTNDIKVYINGVQKWASTATHSNLSFPTIFRLGRDTRSNDGTPYKGLMSDFRIYATALSADDVKSLYQNEAYIDASGNIYGKIRD